MPMRSPRFILRLHFFRAVIRPVELLATAGIFAVGFFMRPLGGWLFGWIADTHGRRTSMIISVLMMCAGSLMVAIMPTYETIGAWAPVLLLIARLTQGLSVGGEYGTAATYMSEVASKGNWGFDSSFQYVTLIGFPTTVRALGVGLTYAVANAMFGGTAEYVALWLKSAGQEQWFAWYVAVMVAIGLVASLIMPDTRKYGYLEGTGQIER